MCKRRIEGSLFAAYDSHIKKLIIYDAVSDKALEIEINANKQNK